VEPSAWNWIDHATLRQMIEQEKGPSYFWQGLLWTLAFSYENIGF